MANIPEPSNTTRNQIFKMYEDRADKERRPHLGASVIGHECERHLWLHFRWAKQEQMEGRILRLLETGKLQEQRLIDDLRASGVEVYAPEEQTNYAAVGGHLGGSMDAAARGLVEAPKTWHVLEFKTASTFSFKKIAKEGVEKAKPQHYAQMQMYMGWAQLDRAMYIVVNKDNDDIYTERVEFSREVFNSMLERAERTIVLEVPPDVPFSGPDSPACKYCQFKGMCYGTDAPDVTCRTCVHATPELDGDARWSCKEHDRDLSVEEQLAACSKHLHMPQLVQNFLKLKHVGDEIVIYDNLLNPDLQVHQPIDSSADITNSQDKATLGRTYEQMERTAVSFEDFLDNVASGKTSLRKL